MGGPHLIKIAFIFQRLEGAAFETGLDIENDCHAATAFYLDFIGNSD